MGGGGGGGEAGPPAAGGGATARADNATSGGRGGGAGQGPRAPPTDPPPPPTADPREYYRTYDAMTGVRIAATLGGFFGLMVLLVLYKSKSKTEKALEDPNFTAAAVAEVEEEERQLQLALEMTAYHQLNPRRASRRSLDTAAYGGGGGACAAAAAWGRRFSSVGVGRFAAAGGGQPLRASLAASLPRRVDEEDAADDEGGGADDDDDADDDDACSLYGDVYGYPAGQLSVPRRPSNITCSSSGSSYLERRDSAVVLSAAPRCPRGRRLSSPPAAATFVDWYYPIDIRVTQPTPGGSPSGSDRTLHRGAPSAADPGPGCCGGSGGGGGHPRLAPLASISSCNSSLGTDYPEGVAAGRRFSSGSADTSTDDEVDPFSTDSGSEGGGGAAAPSCACACGRPRARLGAMSASSSRAPSPAPAQRECRRAGGGEAAPRTPAGALPGPHYKSASSAGCQPANAAAYYGPASLAPTAGEPPPQRHLSAAEGARRYSSPCVVRLGDRPFAQETLF